LTYPQKPSLTRLAWNSLHRTRNSHKYFAKLLISLKPSFARKAGNATPSRMNQAFGTLGRWFPTKLSTTTVETPKSRLKSVTYLQSWEMT
jgi:hypothetical protein